MDQMQTGLDMQGLTLIHARTQRGEYGHEQNCSISGGKKNIALIEMTADKEG